MIKKIVISLTVILISYGVIVGWFLSGDNQRPVLALITDDSYPYIPKAITKFYFYLTDYSIAKHTIQGEPSFNVVATSYDLGGFNNKEILWLLSRLLKNGADINVGYNGYTPLHGAILANSPTLVEFLVKNNADLSLRTNSKAATKCQDMSSFEFAKCIHGLGKQDLSAVLSILGKKT